MITPQNIFCKIMVWLFVGLLCWGTAYAQGDVNIPLNEPFGDPKWDFQGRLNGNRVFEVFRNHGEIGFWTPQRQNLDASDWPAGGDPNPYLDGIAIVVGGSVIDTLGNRVHMVTANYREEVDRSPDLETIWGWQPIPGYLNFDRINQSGAREPIPATSNDRTSWPPAGWPDQPDYFDANGNVEWNGRFGRGQFNAQLEAYYVMDDALDHEFGYVPDPGNPERGGLGLRANVRLYQWVHPLAQDAIFGEFGISNLSPDKGIDSTAFGWWVDNGIGGDTFDDDNGIFARSQDESGRKLDLAITFAPPNSVDVSGVPTGLAGYGFLESPGISDDLKDNDEDGLVDERRDNDAGEFVESGGVADPVRFASFYGRDPAPHWEGDEDQDWKPFEDLNGNGEFDFGESINDDVGTDGVGPGDLNYFGPDPDGSEANFRPDQGEPNFGRTDNDESDQLGMTFFRMFQVPGHPNPQPNTFQPEWFSDDEYWWTERLAKDSIFATPVDNENLILVFASGTFPLEARRTERFSMVIARAVGSRDDLTQMLALKETVQAIFNTDYQFTQPPIKPTLTAVAGDREVRLFWDKLAEESTDPFLGVNVKDFSGYRIYKSTDPLFRDITLVTDAKGNAILKKPLVIFDKKDGFRGAHPVLVAGAPFDMGNESGLQHSYTDTDVINGVTYYYAITAFDTGAVKKNLSPTENTTIIELNNIGEPLFNDKNTVIVTPGVPAAGYQPAHIEGDLDHVTGGAGTGRIVGADIAVPDEIVDGDRYRISFKGEQENNLRVVNTTSYSISRLTNGEEINLIEDAPFTPDPTTGILTTDLFNGILVQIKNDSSAYDQVNSGWITDDGISTTYKGWRVEVEPDTFSTYVIPHSDIEFRFVDSTVIAPKGRGSGRRKLLSDVEVNFTAIAADTAQLRVSIVDVDSSDAFEMENDEISVWERIGTRNRVYWVVRFRPVEGETPQPLGEGDKVLLKTRKTFNTGDFFDIITRAATVNQEEAKKVLEEKKVAAVPNPYIFTNPLEPADPFRLGQESRLMFINLPAQCIIRIFTLSGKLVDTIKVNNDATNGSVKWDLRSSEELRVAPGIYIFHVRDEVNNAEQLGRFVIIR